MNRIIKSFSILAAMCAVSLAAPTLSYAAPGDGGSGTTGGTPNPARVVERHVRTIRDIAFRTNQDLERISFRGVQRIEKMKRNGATSEAITAEGVKISDQLTKRAGVGKENIDAVKTKGLESLTAAGGTPEQATKITDAATNASGRIDTKLTNTSGRVSAAVTKATTP